MTSSDSVTNSSKDVDSTAVEAAITSNLIDESDFSAPVASAIANAKASSGFWSVFLSTFITIFLAELGDKTQVTTMLMSAESQSPLVVFAGAGLALIATSLVGVLLGRWLSTRVSEETLDLCAGILLMVIAIGLVGDIIGS